MKEADCVETTVFVSLWKMLNVVLRWFTPTNMPPSRDLGSNFCRVVCIWAKDGVPNAGRLLRKVTSCG